MLVAWKVRNDVDAIDLARQDTIDDVGCLIDLELGSIVGQREQPGKPKDWHSRDGWCYTTRPLYRLWVHAVQRLLAEVCVDK